MEQCRRVKALGTGTRCMVYRNVELALQWQETSRAAMTQRNVDRGWFLQFKTQDACEAAPPCDVAAYHNIRNQSAPLVPCSRDAPRSEPNCCYCCNFTRVYNEPIGGPWPPTPGANGTRFGDNALGDGQLFWDYRNPEVQDYFAEKVCLGGVTGAADPYVDGTFTDDPGGLGAEHAAVASALQLTDAEVDALQLGAQQAWTKALALLIKAGKYVPQAFRTTPPFVYGGSAVEQASCAQWMRQQCAVPANESTQTYPAAGGTEASARMAIAAFLVARGPWSYLSAPTAIINAGDVGDPIYRLHRLDTGVPTGGCTEVGGVFSRTWSRGHAAVDCKLATAVLDFPSLWNWI